MKIKMYLFVFFLVVGPLWAKAQGIKGRIVDDNKEPLAFATVYIKETASGGTTNEEGDYQVRLAPGTYNVVYQYLGYKTVEKSIVVVDDYVALDIQLMPESVVLRAVEIKAGKEDPAYSIMRRAIAKAKYHTQQLDSYSCKVYVKGSGRLKDVPFFMRKAMKKEGIDSTFAFVTESVSEINYTRPNQYDEKVISVRAIGEDNNTSPNGYINGSFYDKDLAGAISPLSPKAFSYYKFTYMGTFKDRGYEISKIKVKPRSRGDDVFEGVIYIVEDLWAIHSLDFYTTKLGIKFRIKQIYEPLESNVWMPISHEFFVTGKVFGFDFEYNYLATAAEYKVTLNPDLDLELEVIDEKVEKELAKKIKLKPDSKNIQAQEQLAMGKEVTRKDLRKLLNEYEKQERKDKGKNKEVAYVESFKVDSLAHKKDSAYWDAIRPIPLTDLEKKGYYKMDSMALAEKKERSGDTLKTTKRGGFKMFDLLFGNVYKVGDKAHVRIEPTIVTINFNSVEGYNAEFIMNYTKTYENMGWLKVEPKFRYGFDRRELNGTLSGIYSVGERYKKGTIKLEGGKYINQLNSDEPIHPLVNTFTSLFMGENHMKIYGKDFVNFQIKKDWSHLFGVSLGFKYEDRKSLDNLSNYSFVKSDNKRYTSNAPTNVEIGDTKFEDHKASIFMAHVEYRPFQKFYIRNKRKYRLNSFYPTFSLDYTKGLPDVLEGAVDFDLIQFGYKHKIKAGARAIIDIKANYGQFLNADKMYFPDFKHFLGNRTPFVTTDPVGSFRLLPYYDFSTKDKYFTGSMNFQFRKLAVTQIPILRMMGIKESFIANYMTTPAANNYVEVGYGINYIFRFFRLEAISSYQDGQFRDFGVKVGIAANVDDLFN